MFYFDLDLQKFVISLQLEVLLTWGLDRNVAF